MSQKRRPQGRAKRQSQGARSRWQRFLREWGIYLLIAAVIVAVAVVIINQRGGGDFAREAPYAVYFTQGDQGTPAPGGIEQLILADIAAAQRSVEVAAPGLDLDALTTGLVEAHGRGMEVRILEDSRAQKDTAVSTMTERLRQAGIPVVLREGEGALGASFVVIDEYLLWAGSWELSQRGLREDAAYVLRWRVGDLARDFHSEFMEMFADGAFGPNSPETPEHRYMAIPDQGAISAYMMPEGQALSEVLQDMNKATGEIIVLSEGLRDVRLGDRLGGEATRTGMRVWGVLGRGTSDREITDYMQQNGALLEEYAGYGRMYENAIVIDGQIVVIFSQPLDQMAIDQNDGFIILVYSRELGNTFQKEFRRLYEQTQSQGQ